MKIKTKKILSIVLMLCMVLSLINPMQAQAAKKGTSSGISYTAYDTGNGVILILKNKKNYVQSIDVKIVYYNKQKKMIGTSSGSNVAFHSKKKCALYFNAPYDSNYNDIEYSSYKININSEKSFFKTSRVPQISVTSDMGAENVTAKIKNKSKDNLSFIRISIVWYNKNGKAIGYDGTYAECEKKGSTDYITFDFPYDSDYETIYPDSYKIFVNSAYTYA